MNRIFYMMLMSVLMFGCEKSEPEKRDCEIEKVGYVSFFNNTPDQYYVIYRTTNTEFKQIATIPKYSKVENLKIPVNSNSIFMMNYDGTGTPSYAKQYRISMSIEQCVTHQIRFPY